MTITLQSPYVETNGIWLRGNLHAHSTLSDGVLPPEEVVATYERLGYDFLALSDHDLVAPIAALQGATTMTLLTGNEVTANGPHLLHVGACERVAPDTDRQAVINAVRESGGFVVLNHPNWGEDFDHFPYSRLVSLNGYVGVETYNGIIEVLPGSPFSLDKWDRLLSEGRRVWAFANDDFHAPAHAARGWNMVQAADRSAEAVLAALRAGRFYCSTGVRLAEIEVASTEFRVAAEGAAHIRFLGRWGRELALVEGSEATYRVVGNEGGYVRAEVHGEGYRAAWTQPVWLEQAG